MIILNSFDILNGIATIIKDSSTDIYIVSPQLEIESKSQLYSNLVDALGRKINITIITKKYNNCNFASVRKLGIKPIKLDNLDSNMVLNESSALLTSQNFLEPNFEKLCSVGFLNTDENEVDILNKFLNQIILPVKNTKDYLYNVNNMVKDEYPIDYDSNFLHHILMQNFYKLEIDLVSNYLRLNNILEGCIIRISIHLEIEIISPSHKNQINELIEQFDFTQLHNQFNILKSKFTSDNIYQKIFICPKSKYLFFELLEDYIFLLKYLKDNLTYK